MPPLYFFSISIFIIQLNSFSNFPIIIQVNIHNKQQMTHIFNSDLSIDYQSLEKQYPGIKRINFPLDSQQWKSLQSLANLIKYNVPKAYYTQEIIQIDEKIQQLYFQYIQRPNEDFDQIDRLPAQIMRKQSQLSDQQEAQVVRHIQKQTNILPVKFSITQVTQFVQSFNIQQQSLLVNSSIIEIVSILSKGRRERGNYENAQKKQTKRQGKNRKFNKYQEAAENREKSKNQMTIIMGDKIPMQVKQERNRIKQAALNSFAVTSIEKQKQISQNQKEKIQISLILNKAVEQNMQEIFLDIKELIKQKKDLAQYLIRQIINKCTHEFKMITVYVSFICLFTKIHSKTFSWQWVSQNSGRKITNMNQFHCLFIQMLQQSFKQVIQDKTQSRKVRALSFMIGNLLVRKKLSKRVLLDVNNMIVEKIIEQYDQNQKNIQEDYLQASVCLIQSIQGMFDIIQSKFKIHEIISKRNQQKILQIKKGQLPTNMEQLLYFLNDMANFSTTRINCIIKNLFQRMHKGQKLSPKVIENPEKKNSQMIPQYDVRNLMEGQNGLEVVVSLYKKEKCSKLLEHLLIYLCEGAQGQVIMNMKNLTKNLKITSEEFFSFWEKSYINFVYSECDLPFMTSGLGFLANHYLGQDAERCVIEAEQQAEDHDDINYFMRKLNKKVQQFSNFKANGDTK